MQIAALALAFAATGFATHPGLGDKLPAPRPQAQQPAPQSLRIEAIVDRGLIVEMVIRCGENSATISYSKAEKLYCTPQMTCSPTLVKTLEQTCGPAGR